MDKILENYKKYCEILERREFDGRKLTKQQEWYFLGCRDALRELIEAEKGATV